jgi:hypothetical protein
MRTSTADAVAINATSPRVYDSKPHEQTNTNASFVNETTTSFQQQLEFPAKSLGLEANESLDTLGIHGFVVSRPTEEYRLAVSHTDQKGRYTYM